MHTDTPQCLDVGDTYEPDADDARLHFLETHETPFGSNPEPAE
jgi:hypothetical protein